MLKIKFLPAFDGDSILISIDKFNILIDGGMTKTYFRKLKAELEKLEQIDLVVLTHIDRDHILGLIELFKDEEQRVKVKRVWFNSMAKMSELFTDVYDENRELPIDNDNDQNISFRQGESMEKLLKDSGIDYELIYLEKQSLYKFENFELEILSPNKRHLERLHKHWQKDQTKRENKDINALLPNSDSIESLYANEFKNDTRPANKSSIAFNLKHEGKNYLFLADSNVTTVIKSLKEFHKKDSLYATLVKLSHHGSKRNINQKFLDVVSSHRFVVSTNGDMNRHPSKEALSRIIKNPKRDEREIEFWFNYPEDSYRNSFTFTAEELTNKEYNFKLIFAEEDNGVKYEL